MRRVQCSGWLAACQQARAQKKDLSAFCSTSRGGRLWNSVVPPAWFASTLAPTIGQWASTPQPQPSVTGSSSCVTWDAHPRPLLLSRRGSQHMRLQSVAKVSRLQLLRRPRGKQQSCPTGDTELAGGRAFLLAHEQSGWTLKRL